MKYRYWLNGNLITEPRGWDKFVSNITRDKSARGISVERELTLTFGATEYEYFKAVINAQGYCFENTLRIEITLDNGNTWSEFHNGIVYNSDITFDEKRKECTAKVQDNSFYAYINNNIDLGAYLHVDKSKNGATITTPTLYQVAFHEVPTGAYYPNSAVGGYEYRCYKVYDVFQFLVAYMTDNKVQFVSNTFGVGGIFHDYFITTGYVLCYSIANGYNGAVNPAGITQQQFEASWEQLSFKTFFDEMAKRFNLLWWIEYVGGQPYIRIEREQDSRLNNLTTLANHYVDELTWQVGTDALYANIKLAQGVYTNASPITSLPDIPLLGFMEEEVSIAGQCNLRQSLDLTTDFVHDSNTIEDCLANGWAPAFTREYDKNVFVINATYYVTNPLPPFNDIYQSVASNWLYAAPPYFYNEQLNNANIYYRYYDGFANDIVAWWATGIDYSFTAVQNPAYAYVVAGMSPFGPVTTEPINFNDNNVLGIDPTGVYGNSTTTPVAQADSYFQALAATGIYTFSFEAERVDVPFAGSANAPYKVMLKHYDAAGTTLITQQTITYGTGLAVGTYYNVVNTFNPIVVNAGERVQIALTIENVAGVVPNPYGKYYFRCTASAGGTLIAQDTTKASILEYNYKVPMNYDEYKQIESNLTSYINFRRYGDAGNRRGWIKQLKYDHNKCIADITLLTSKLDSQ